MQKVFGERQRKAISVDRNTDTLYRYMMNKPQTRIGLLWWELNRRGAGKRVTQSRLADLTGCSTVLMRKMIAGERRLNEYHATRLAGAIGVDMDWLMGKGSASPIRANNPFGTLVRYNPETYWQRVNYREGKVDKAFVRHEGRLVSVSYLLTMDAISRLLVFAHRKNKAILALDRIALAMRQIAEELGYDSKGQNVRRAVAIHKRLRSKNTMDIGRTIVRRFCRDMWAASSSRDVRGIASNDA